MRGLDVGGQVIERFSRMQRHHHLFQRGVAGAFADAVDADLDLPRARYHARQCVRGCQAQIVVTMGRPNHAVAAGGALNQVAHHRGVFIWGEITNGIGDIQRGRASLNRDAQRMFEKFHVAAAGIFGGELYVVAVLFGIADHLTNTVEDLFAGHTELVLQVDI